MKYWHYFIMIFLNFIFLTNNVSATNYYFSNSSGNDTYTSTQAQNSSTPWKSLTKLNQYFGSLQPGDTIFFKRGDVFTGSINITQSGTIANPIVFSAYGSGQMPVISGFETFVNWSDKGSGIWESNCVSCNSEVNVLLFDGANKAMGRYPNSNAQNGGYLTFESHINKTQITDNELNASPNWTGSELVLRTNRWIIDRDLITNHSGNTIFYNTTSRYEPGNHFGYFIQNSIATLDVLGEWFYNSKTSKMNCFFGTNTPTSYTVKASVIDTLVVINRQNNITIKNISFRGANRRTFSIHNAKNISITNCDILFSGINGIEADNSSGILLESNSILNTNNKAIQLFTCSNSSVRNNKIKNTGIYAGMGLSADNSYSAIDFEGNDNVIEYNDIDSTGYSPILFEGNNVLIKNNYINNFCLIKDDGGGIYTWEGNTSSIHNNRIINGNIINNGIGAPEGTDDLINSYAYGIYMDDNTDHVEIINNSVSNCRAGYLNHNSNNIIFNNNTLFNNVMQLDFSKNSNSSCSNCAIEENVLKNNIFFSKEPNQLIMIINSPDDIKNFGIFDNNYYSRPFNEGMIIQNKYTPAGSSIKVDEILNLEDWQSIHSQDINSHKAPVSFPYYTVNNILGSNKVGNGTFNTNISGVYCDSPINNCTATWSTGQLDGGAVKFSFPSVSGKQNRSHLIVDVGNIDSSKNYILKFSLLGSKNSKNLEVYLRQSLKPYKTLSELKPFKITNKRTEYEFLFSKPISEADASLNFSIDEQDGTVWIDNIKFLEADVTIANTDEFIRYEYNATQSPTTFELLSNYIDNKSVQYSGTVTLQPFTSVVLMKTDSTGIEVPPNNPKSEDLKIYPIPSLGEFNIDWEGSVNGFELTIVDVLGRRVTKQTFSSNKAIINTRSWTTGLYFCIVNNGKKKIIKKILVE